MNVKDVHTEHCCSRHGCKYGDDDCTVFTKKHPQSYPCEYCDFEKEDDEVIFLRDELETLKRSYSRRTDETVYLLNKAGRLEEAFRWALPLALRGVESIRIERMLNGHLDITGTYRNGETWAGIYQTEVDEIENARALLRELDEEKKK